MKISIQIDGKEVASAKSGQNIAPASILEKATILGAEDAGPAPALAFGRAPAGLLAAEELGESASSSDMAIDCGQAPVDFQSDATPEMQVSGPSIEAKDAGKAALL
jgi:hypothetical protein